MIQLISNEKDNYISKRVNMQPVPQSSKYVDDQINIRWMNR